MISIDLSTPLPELQDYLKNKGWLLPEEEILATSKAGEGNMNVVIRLKTDQRSLILKQSRPYVQKYQQIPAPLERISVEHQFYAALEGQPIEAHIPKIYHYDPQDFLLAMEDLGQVEDLTQLYSAKVVSQDLLDKLTAIAKTIHQAKPGKTYPLNLELRQLNHQHIFVLPFLEDNGFDLDDIQPGLQELSLPYKTDTRLKEVVETISKRYLSEGHSLIHGDYYPGSWMTAKGNLYVIDPEFSFVGDPEFDLGVMAAHCIMVTAEPDYVGRIAETYRQEVDLKLIKQFAGIEIIRRLIGLAQLPLSRTIKEKDYLLQEAKKLILG
ncbi:MAG: phosphotransferase [Flavobacteriaceae bacterium]